jgi:type I restriction enzyme S subunit
MSVPHRKISELFPDIRIGGTPSRGTPDYFGGDNPWVSIRDMEGQPLVTKTAETLSDLGVSNSNCKLVRAGSLLFSFKLTVGKVAFAGVDLYTNEAIASFDPIEAENAGIDLEYLSFVLPLSAKTDFTKNCMGAALLNKDKIRDLVIPFPDIHDQRCVAKRLKIRLTEVETARQAAVSQMQDAAALKSKALETIFAGISNRRTIGTAAKVQSGYAFKSDTFKTSGVRLLRNTNILPGIVYWDDQAFLSEDESKQFTSYELNDGDVLISLDRPIISSGIKVARINAADLPALLVQRVGRFLIDPDQLDADYLYAYLQTQMFISAISGHDQSLGVPHISPTQVENVEIPLPDVTTQKKLSKQLNEVTHEWEVIRSAIQSQFDDLARLPNSILAQAFES